MADIIRIKKGLDIPLKGDVTDASIVELRANRVAVVPDDLPRLSVESIGKKSVMK